MNANAVNIAVVEGKTISQATELRSNPQGQPVRIKAVPNGKYVLAEGEDGFAPENITIKRVGKDLHIALEGTDPDQPQLIIEGFFDAQGQLVGVGEDGAYYEYISSDADQDHSAAFLMDGVASPQVLGAEQLSGFDSLVAGSGIGYFWPALLGLAGLGLAGLALGGGGGGGGGGHEGSIPSGEGSAPVLDNVIDYAGNKTGPIQSGEPTDDSTPTFSGSGTPGSTVVIKDGDKVIGEVNVGDDGKWIFTPTTPLDEGKHEITLVERNPDGTVSKPGQGFDLIIDLTAPGKGGVEDITDNVGSITGTITNGGTTDDTTPTLSGGGLQPGDTVTIFDNGQPLDTVTVGDNGTWTYTPPPRDEGKHDFTVTVTDPAGNTSPESDPYTVIIDITKPDQPLITSVVDDQGAITGNLASGDTTDDAQPQISGTAEPGSTVIIYDNGKEIGRERVAADGTWSHLPVPTLNNGNHVLTVEAMDAAGNVSDPSDSFDFNLIAGGAPTAPAITGVMDDVDNVMGNVMPGEVTNDARPDIYGTGTAGSTVSVYADGTLIGTATVQSNGQWVVPGTTLLNDLREGLNNITATTTNAAGNESAPTGLYPITVDITAPSASTATLTDDVGAFIGAINSGDTTDDSNPTYSGTAEPGATVIIYDNGVEIARVPVDATGDWTFIPTRPLDEGDHSFTNVVMDPAGNTSPVSPAIDFSVDTSLVVISITQVQDNVGSITGDLSNGGVTDDINPTLHGQATANSTVTLYDNGMPIGTTMANGLGQWTFTTPDLPEGNHSLTATATTAAGISEPTSAFNLEIDTTAPGKPGDGGTGGGGIEDITDNVGSITGTITNGGITDDTTPTLSGGGLQPGDSVTIIDNGQPLDTVTVDKDGNWTYTPPPQNQGKHDFTITVTDPAGNTSPESDPYTVIIDTTKPNQPEITSVVDDQGAVTGILNAGATTDDAEPQIQGTAEPGSTVIIYDNGKEIGREQVAADGTWSHMPVPPLTVGDHTLSVEAMDAAGNVSDPSDPFDFSLITAGAPDAPAITGVMDDVDGYIGNIMQDGLTNDARPDITGTGVPGSLISVYANGELMGTTTVESTGLWTLSGAALLTDLGEGLNNLTATTTNQAGNVSDPTELYPITVDTKVPEVSTATLSDNFGDITGTINFGDATDDNTPTYSGTAQPGATVIIYNKDVEIGRAPVDSTGTWTFTPNPPLFDGDHSFTHAVLSTAGNLGPASVHTDFMVDTRPIIISITEVEDNAGPITGPLINDSVTDDTTPTLRGVATANSTVTLYDNGEPIGTAIADESGQWEFITPILDEGNHSLTATVTTLATGESAHTTPFNLEVDITAPGKPGDGGTGGGGIEVITDDEGSITGTIANGGSTDDTTPILSGGGLTPGDTVTIFDNGQRLDTVTVGDDGNWTYTPTPRDEGKHDFTLTVTDPAGNTSPESDPYTVIIDTTKPNQPEITSVIDNQGDIIGDLAAGDITDDAEPQINGTAEPGSTVIIYDNGDEIGRELVAADGTWSHIPVPPLNVGDHNLSVEAMDAAGNVSDPSEPFDFTLIGAGAPVAPEITGVMDDVDNVLGNVISGGHTNDIRPDISGTATPGMLVSVYANGELIGTVTAAATGLWTLQGTALLNDLGEGLNNLTATTTNAAGNVSPATELYPVTVDTAAPLAQAIVESMSKDSGDNIGDFITNDGSAGRLVQGSLSAALASNEKVEVSFDGGTTWVNAIVAGDKWSALDQGSHNTDWQIQTRVIDLAGNVNETSHNVVLDTTVTAPTSIVWDGSIITAGFNPADVALGDKLHLLIDGKTVEHVLTQAEIDAGQAQLPWDSTVQGNPASMDVAVVDSAGNISQYLSYVKSTAIERTEGFEDHAGQIFTAGQVLDLNGFTLTATTLSWGSSGYTGLNSYLGTFASPPTSNALIMTGGSEVLLTLDPGVNHNYIKFHVGDFNNAEGMVAIFRGPGGEEVHRTTINPGEAGLDFDIYRETPIGVGFTSVSLKASGTGALAFWIDDIELGNTTYAQGSLHTPDTNQTITESAEYYGADADNIFSIADTALLSNSSSGIHGGDGIDTLQLTGQGQVLNLTQLGHKLESIEVIDLTGTGNNTLNLSLGDVLAQGGTSLFTDDGYMQMMVKGNAGDVVNLDDLLPDGTDPGSWANAGQVTVEGVVYTAFRHDTLEAELLTQQGIQTNLV